MYVQFIYVSKMLLILLTLINLLYYTFLQNIGYSGHDSLHSYAFLAISLDQLI